MLFIVCTLFSLQNANLILQVGLCHGLISVILFTKRWGCIEKKHSIYEDDFYSDIFGKVVLVRWFILLRGLWSRHCEFRLLAASVGENHFCRNLGIRELDCVLRFDGGARQKCFLGHCDFQR